MWEHKGNKIIEEKRLCLDCNECKAGDKRYGEGTLKSKEYQEIMKEIEQLKREVANLKTQGKLVIKGKKHNEENQNEVI